jgi:hypothetical protein
MAVKLKRTMGWPNGRPRIAGGTDVRGKGLRRAA